MKHSHRNCPQMSNNFAPPPLNILQQPKQVYNVDQAQWPRGSKLGLVSSEAEVKFQLLALLLLQSPWIRD